MLQARIVRVDADACEQARKIILKIRFDREAARLAIEGVERLGLFAQDLDGDLCSSNPSMPSGQTDFRPQFYTPEFRMQSRD